MEYLILCLLTSLQCSSALPLWDFYSFGRSAGDFPIEPTDDGNSGLVNLSMKFPFFNIFYTSLYVNNNGILSFNELFKEYNPRMFPVLSPLVNPFWADADTTQNGTVWYGERSQDIHDLDCARQNVRKYFCQEDFEPNFVFVATWDKVPHYNQGSKTNTFQCILISDGQHSFVIFHYADRRIEWTTGDASNGTNGLGGNAAQVGLNAGNGSEYEIVPGSGTPSIINITMTSNVGIDGVWAFKTDGNVSECFKSSIIQLKFKINISCSSCINTSFIEKSMDIAGEVRNEMLSRCNCSYLADTIISNGTLLCFVESSSFVTYRAQIQGNMEVSTFQLISYIEEWLTTSAVLNVRGELLHAESICAVAIPSWDEPECILPYKSTTPEYVPATNQNEPECDINCENISITIVTPVVVIFIGVVTVIVIVVLTLLKLKSKWRSSQKNLTTVLSPTACAHLNTCRNSVERIDLSESHHYECVKSPTQKDEVMEVADVHEVLCSPCEAYSVQVFNGITENEEHYEVVRYT